LHVAFPPTFVVKDETPIIMETQLIEDIDRLIASVLAQAATDEEITKLANWIRASEDNAKYFSHIQNIWSSSDSSFDVDQQQTLAAYEKVEQKIAVPQKRVLSLKYLQRIAAAIIIPLLIGSYFLGSRIGAGKNAAYDAVAYNEVFAANGTRSLLKLPDGSQVWLNSRSSLRYPLQFTEACRKVFLKGEAYFEVHSDASKPFIVQTQSVSVRATGTKFNVQALSSTSKTEVSLLEGKVAVSKAPATESPVLLKNLKPNEHLTFDSISGETQVVHEDVYKYLSWKDGKLIFRNDKLSDVVRKIGQLYNVDIEIEGQQLKDFRYRATFQEETIADVMKLLKISSPIDYKELARKSEADGSFGKRKFIIFSAKK